jgi:hypothetical protein
MEFRCRKLQLSPFGVAQTHLSNVQLEARLVLKALAVVAYYLQLHSLLYTYSIYLVRQYYSQLLN